MTLNSKYENINSLLYQLLHRILIDLNVEVNCNSLIVQVRDDWMHITETRYLYLLFMSILQFGD